VRHTDDKSGPEFEREYATLGVWVHIVRLRIILVVAYHVPYFCLHLLITSGMEAFVNSPATLPDGPGGRFCWCEDTRRRIMAAMNAAESIDTVNDIL
jgi:hypothetical protein